MNDPIATLEWLLEAQPGIPSLEEMPCRTLDEVKGKALMVHVGGDNMADNPQPLGGGGERFACGVIK